MKELLTYQEVSKILNLPIGTLYSLVHKRQIDHVRLGKRIVRFRSQSIDKLVATSVVRTLNEGRQHGEQ